MVGKCLFHASYCCLVFCLIEQGFQRIKLFQRNQGKAPVSGCIVYVLYILDKIKVVFFLVVVAYGNIMGYPDMGYCAVSLCAPLPCNISYWHAYLGKPLKH